MQTSDFEHYYSQSKIYYVGLQLYLYSEEADIFKSC